MQAAPEQRYERHCGALFRHLYALCLSQTDHAAAGQHAHDCVDDLQNTRPCSHVLLCRGDGQIQVTQTAPRYNQSRNDSRHAEQRLLRAEQLLKRYLIARLKRQRQHSIYDCTDSEQRDHEPDPFIACRRQAGAYVKTVQQVQRAQRNPRNAQHDRQNRQELRCFHVVSSSKR